MFDIVMYSSNITYVCYLRC